MQRVLPVRGAIATAAVFLLISLAGCGGGTSTDKVTQLILTPTTISLNEGAVTTLSAVAEDASGNTVAADISFTSNNTNIATVSSGGLVCGGVWDANIINCNASNGQAGVGVVTITATATAFNVSATATVYVHEQVDLVETQLGANCTSMGRPITIAGFAFSTTAPGCSPSAPCNITSTVGPFTFGANDSLVAATSSGIVSTYSSTTGTPTYVSGGTFSGSKGQTCNLSDFNGINNATATLALTGSNSVAAGTQLTIINPGYGATAAPTTAVLSNGTATCSGTADVSTVITNGVLTGQAPGATTVFASVSGVNGVGVPYLTCPVATIVVHDASSSNTNFTLAPQGTQNLTADVYDTNNVYITPTLAWGSSSTATAGVAVGTSGNNPATVTAVTGGTAYITASCGYPGCNRGVPAQYSQNLVTINVTTPGSTTVYAANTNSTSLVPINTSTNAVGTTITLPVGPNSIVAAPSGATVYLGGSVLMSVNVSTGVVTTYNVPGQVIAVSADSTSVLISDPSTSAIYYFNVPDTTLTSSISGATTSSAFTPDSQFNEWVDGTELSYGLQTGVIGKVTLPSAANAMDISGQGGLTYITSAMGRVIYAYSTCNQTQDQAITATSPTLVKALPNGTGAVAADSPDIDVVSTPAMLNAGCPVTTQSSINSYDLGAGTFTAQQLLVSYDASHAYIIPNLPEVIGFNLATLRPSIAPLFANAIPYNGGITLDGSSLYVGASDGAVHVINTSSMTDSVQIPVTITDPNGNPVPPNLVTVVP